MPDQKVQVDVRTSRKAHRRIDWTTPLRRQQSFGRLR